MQHVLWLRLAALLALAVAVWSALVDRAPVAVRAAETPAPAVAAADSGPRPSGSAAESAGGEADRIFTTLVTHAFGPDTTGREELYYKTRFFTARLQARMRYLLSQSDLKDDGTGGRQALSLSQDDTAQLNEVVGEMWLASRKLYQSWGCLSYDLTLCDGRAATGAKIAPGDKEAMAKWEHRLGVQFAADKTLTRGEAEGILGLAKGIQDVLLASPAGSAA